MQIVMNSLLALKVKMRFLDLSVHYEKKYTHNMF